MFYLDTYYPLSKSILNAWDSASEWKQNSKLQFVWSKTYTSALSIEKPTQGQEWSASCPQHSMSRLWHEVWFKISIFVPEAWMVWSYLTNCNKLSEGREGNLSLARNLCKFGGGGEKKSKLSHNLLPLLSKNAPLFSPSSPIHWEHSQIRSETCKDCIHTSLVQTVSLSLSSYIQPYFLGLFCALKNNFRNKM